MLRLFFEVFACTAVDACTGKVGGHLEVQETARISIRQRHLGVAGFAAVHLGEGCRSKPRNHIVSYCMVMNGGELTEEQSES